jgi:hypothetical protein
MGVIAKLNVPKLRQLRIFDVYLEHSTVKPFASFRNHSNRVLYAALGKL